MDDERSIDLRDRKGRLGRAAIAAAVGIVVTMAVFQVMDSVAATPNPDPIQQASVIGTAVVVWVAASGITLALLTALTRWVRRRARERAA
ncbi:MAG: hypothetical protein H6Q90_43 [Deltaproteobacteria bacterium]|nr:hypothetical protein [Deltaproteobacteria bacterium]